MFCLRTKGNIIMTLREYQEEAKKTAVYPNAGDGSDYATSYTVLGLCGEAGELANLFKKYLRRDFSTSLKDIDFLRNKMLDELGDALWYVSAVANELDISLDSLAQRNLNKLKGREERGTIKGSGDER